MASGPGDSGGAAQKALGLRGSGGRAGESRLGPLPSPQPSPPASAERRRWGGAQATAAEPKRPRPLVALLLNPPPPFRSFPSPHPIPSSQLHLLASHLCSHLVSPHLSRGSVCNEALLVASILRLSDVASCPEPSSPLASEPSCAPSSPSSASPPRSLRRLFPSPFASLCRVPWRALQSRPLPSQAPSSAQWTALLRSSDVSLSLSVLLFARVRVRDDAD